MKSHLTSVELRGTESIVLRALMDDHDAFQFASDELRNDDFFSEIRDSAGQDIRKWFVHSVIDLRRKSVELRRNLDELDAQIHTGVCSQDASICIFEKDIQSTHQGTRQSLALHTRDGEYQAAVLKWPLHVQALHAVDERPVNTLGFNS